MRWEVVRIKGKIGSIGLWEGMLDAGSRERVYTLEQSAGGPQPDVFNSR